MKKLKLTIAGDEPREVNGWALDVPGLAAWNNTGKLVVDDKEYTIKTSWQLIHIASGMHIDSVYKREQCAALAELLAPITDWTATDIDSLSLARAILALREWWATFTEARRLEKEAA